MNDVTAWMPVAIVFLLLVRGRFNIVQQFEQGRYRRRVHGEHTAPWPRSR